MKKREKNHISIYDLEVVKYFKNLKGIDHFFIIW